MPPLVLNIRGTSGSGKSTIVRELMKLYAYKTPVYVEGRRKPFLYRCTHESANTLAVMGHYETPTGGCDTLHSLDDLFPRVYEEIQQNANSVAMEGIMLADDTKRTLRLAASLPVYIIGLTTPLVDCLAGVQARRDARGDTRPLSPKKTTERFIRCNRYLKRLADTGVRVEMLDRTAALIRCRELLGV